MFINTTVLEKTGEVTGIFDIITMKITVDNREKLKKEIIKVLRYDREENMHSKYILPKNPSKDSSKVVFLYGPAMYRQAIAACPLPHKIEKTVKIIDTFTCIGSRFGLQPLSVFVEVCQSTCGEKRIWAKIYYVADSEIPACTIKATTFRQYLED